VLDQLGTTSLVDPAAQAAEQVDDLTTGEVGPQGELARHVGQAPVQGCGLRPRVPAEQAHRPLVGAQQPEQHPDRGRLP